MLGRERIEPHTSTRRQPEPQQEQKDIDFCLFVDKKTARDIRIEEPKLPVDLKGAMRARTNGTALILL